MDIFYRLISLLGGLALFLYGMRTMGNGLKSSSGGALKAVMSKVTERPVTGFLLGVVATCIIQSSTATIVLTVGLVGAGFLSFRQSASIVLGANVGTAITAQIIRLMDLEAGSGSLLYFFKSDNLAPLALIAGIVLIMFVKGRWSNTVGVVCMGFGMLFVGLMNMSSAVSSLGDELSGLLLSFEGNYVLGFLAGVLVTGVIQSSSAVVGILQSVASSVGIRFCAVFAVIVGVNIGDCLTTFLVCRVGASREQIRTCLVHIVYNILAAILVFAAVAVLRLTGILGDELWYASLDAGGVANIHGLFRLVPAVLLLPFAGRMADFCVRIAPDQDGDREAERKKSSLRELDKRLITNPGVAMTEVQHLLTHMADVAIESYDGAVAQIFSYAPERSEYVKGKERQLDEMADASNEFLVSISPYIQLESDYRKQIYQIRALTCFERIGDLAANIINNVETLHSSGLELSEAATRELKVLTEAVKDILAISRDAFKSGRISMARQVEPLEEVIDELVELMKSRAVRRSARGECMVSSGIEFQNILQNMERISDQCSDLAVYLLGKADDRINGREHEYIRQLHHSGNSSYLDAFETSREKYFSQLDGAEGDVSK